MDQRFLVFVIVLLPIISACIGFTVHFAIRPLVETLIDAMQEFGELGRSDVDRARIARLEDEVHALRGELRRIGSGTAPAATRHEEPLAGSGVPE